MASLRDNKPLRNSLTGLYAVLLLLLLDIVPGLGELVELVEPPSESFSIELTGGVVCDSVGCAIVEWALSAVL